MVSDEVALTVLHYIGIISSLCIFVAPIPTFWEIIKKRSANENFPSVYFANALNCLYWVLHGTFYSPGRDIMHTIVNGIGLVLQLAFFSIGALAYGKHKRWAVVQTKNNQFLSLPIGLLVLINATVRWWYSVILVDIFGITSHCVGILSGALQIILYLICNTAKTGRKIQTLMVGLGATGKTTILYKLKFGGTTTTLPTKEYNMEIIKHKNICFTIWDVGGGDEIRPLWKLDLKNFQVLIFVVDSNDRDRVVVARDVLQGILNEDELRDDTVLLVFANKQDLPNAMTAAEIADKLGLHSLRRHRWLGLACPTCGEGLYEGLDSLVQQHRQQGIRRIRLSRGSSHFFGRPTLSGQYCG